MEEFTPIKILKVAAGEVGVPKNDGSVGSALYKVPFRISAPAPAGWAKFFVQAWDRPPQSSLSHRPGTASVVGDRIILGRTTLEEVEQYHRATLLLAIDQANTNYIEFLASQRSRDALEEERIRQHQEDVAERAKRLTFD